ncbi:HTH-type transcriptional regulator ImmR [Anaerolineae bacterium]|nr:HTH-type transcriptional regulator ImmR [Anaerolineae bacterium]
MTDDKQIKRKRAEPVDPIVLAARLKTLMERKGLSQAQLADRADVARSAMNQFLSGERKPSADALAKLANVLDVSTDYLLGQTDETVLADLLQHEKVLDLIELFRQLSTADQDRVVGMVRLMVNTADPKSPA